MNHGKPVVRVELESAAWLVQITIWISGEAVLETIRLAVNKHYDLTGRDDLNVLLDELVRLLVEDRAPAAAVAYHAPGSPTRRGDAASSAASGGDRPTAT